MNSQIREIILILLEPIFQQYIDKINKCLNNKSSELETNNAEVWIRQIKNTMDFIDGVSII